MGIKIKGGVLISRIEAARLIGITPDSINKWIQRGLLSKVAQVGNRPLFFEKDVRIASIKAEGDGRGRRRIGAKK